MVSFQPNNNKEKMTRFYLVWRCEVTHPSMRPNGRKQTEGCGHWSVRMTRHEPVGEIGRAGEVQATCSQCGRKKRLSRKLVKLYEYDNKVVAETKQRLLNELGEI